jgi:hypothetical protein
MTTGAGRAGEGDHPHPRIGEQQVADFRRHAGHHVEHPRRQAGLVEQVGDDGAGDRRLLRRLQDEGVAGGQCIDDLLHRQQERRVERRYAGDDAERLAQRDRDLSRHGHWHGFAHHVAGVAGGGAQRIHHVLDLPQRLGERQAAFLDQHVADFTGAARNDVQSTQQHDFALRHQGLAPALRGAVGGVDSQFDFLGARLLGPREHLAGCGIEVVRQHVARRLGPLAVDEQLVVREAVNNVERSGIHRNISSIRTARTMQ